MRLPFTTDLASQVAASDPNLIHYVGDFQYWLDRLGLKIPRALCGALLAGNQNDPEPTVPCPACADLI
jgi:hypothetical protein